MSEPFLDTNVLLYLLADGAKADTAEALLASGGVVSVQVLNEFSHVARRKFQAPWAALRHTLAVIRENVTVQPQTLEVHDLGLQLTERFLLSVFDGQILAAARIAGCDVVYSEDMQDGLKLDGLTVRNPFR